MVAAVEALMKKERQDEIPSLPIKELGVTTLLLLDLNNIKALLVSIYREIEHHCYLNLEFKEHY